MSNPATKRNLLLIFSLIFLMALAGYLYETRNPPAEPQVLPSAISEPAVQTQAPTPIPEEKDNRVELYFNVPASEGYDPAPLESWLKVLLGPEGNGSSLSPNDCGESERGDTGPTCLEFRADLVSHEYLPGEKEKLQEGDFLEEALFYGTLTYRGKERHFNNLGELPAIFTFMTENSSVQKPWVTVDVVVNIVVEENVAAMNQWVEELAGVVGEIANTTVECRIGECTKFQIRMPLRDLMWSKEFKSSKPPNIEFIEGHIIYLEEKYRVESLNALPREMSSLIQEWYRRTLPDPDSRREYRIQYPTEDTP